MEVKQVIDYTFRKILKRKEIFELAVDRGLEKGMQIEEWLLIEMLANLKKLKHNKKLSAVEGEHSYHKGKSRLKCDLWWKTEDKEFWLEVKTIVLAKDIERGSLQNISNDLDKMREIRSEGEKYHLSIVFPVGTDEKLKYWKKEISIKYRDKGLLKENVWKSYVKIENKKEIILFLLFRE
ncbi:hypothetical protein JW756_01335 [Candidatus Woesearchaeota archaeon]|nr:hypothetical protein [Candidatus Woesearchaeota archaeon]